MAASKVLIVEDDAFTALGMADVLTFAGFEVVGTARRVAEALALSTRTRPDVAIFDIRLAGRGRHTRRGFVAPDARRPSGFHQRSSE
jgi:DNA-binding NarL/FixJ family response regulator